MNRIKKTLFRLLRKVLMVIITALVMLNISYGLQSVSEITNEFTGTGRHTPPQENTITVTVSKVWIPAANHPQSIAVQLYRNGAPHGNPVILNDGNGWKHIWTGLDESSVWTVDEPDVPAGYAKTITGLVRDGFVITNTRSNTPGNPDKPTEPDKPVEPKDPDIPTGPGFPPKPNVPAKPNEPTTPDEPVVPDNPVVPGIPYQPIDPGKPPKTGDDTDARLWFIALASCAYILRHILFIKKEKEGE